MSDTDGKKPLGLGWQARVPVQVKQSFSHGRTHAVVVETKRKRVVVPTPVVTAKPAGTSGGATGAAVRRIVGRCRPSARLAFRMPKWNAAWPCALKSRASPSNRKTPAAPLTKRHAARNDRMRKREEMEAREREERQREAALRAKAEEDERLRPEARPKLRPSSRGPQGRYSGHPAPPARSPCPGRTRCNRQARTQAGRQPSAPRCGCGHPRGGERGPAGAKPGLSPRKTDREREDRERAAKARPAKKAAALAS